MHWFGYHDWGRLLALTLLALPSGRISNAAVVGQNGFSVIATFSPGISDDLGSFDWAGDGKLYYAAGNFDYPTPRLEIASWDGSNTVSIHSVNKWPGGGVIAYSSATGDYVYFYEDDPSTFSQNLFRWAISSGHKTELISSANLSGLHVHQDTLYMTAVGSGGFGTNAIYHSPIAADGSVGPLIFLGDVGIASGPVAFDTSGNLYLADGLDTTVYKYTAAELAAAIADPLTQPLADAVAHVWANYSELTLSDGVTTPAGGTGMVFNLDGDLMLSATRFGALSALVRFEVTDDGANSGHFIVAEGTERFGSVRLHRGQIYFNDTTSVFWIVPEPTSVGLMLSGLIWIAICSRPAYAPTRMRERIAT